MAKDSQGRGDLRLGRLLRMGRRLGQRAGRVVAARFTKSEVAPPGSVAVTFEFAGKNNTPVEAEVPGGTSLLAAAARLGLEINHYCGGQCSCGTCRVEVLDGAGALSAQQGMEQMVLGSSHTAAGNRLACQARILGPVRVRIPEWF